MSDLWLTRDLLDQTSGIVEPARLDALRRQVEERATACDRLAESAPNNDARTAATSAAQAFRGSMSAIDAEQLLHTGPTPPVQSALDEVASKRAANARALDVALAQLDAISKPEGANTATPAR